MSMRSRPRRRGNVGVDMTSRKELKRRTSQEEPSLRIGKSNVTPGIIEELERQLESRELVKVKFLRSSDASKREEMVSRLSKETRSELIEERGNTITLFRARKGIRKDI